MASISRHQLFQNNFHSIPKTNPILLYNKDFQHGTFRIVKPGYYKLAESITFHPNPMFDFKPLFSDKLYTSLAFSFGFFCAISIESSNVALDLNQKTLQQSPEHALQQRFFSLIELANTPFLPNQGPGNFGPCITNISNIHIFNGFLSRSSHYNIHGNNISHLHLHHLTMTDFEVSAISLNNASFAYCHHLTIGPNCQSVPIISTYSAARFATLFTQKILIDYCSLLTSKEYTKLLNLYNILKTRIDAVYKEILEKGYTCDTLFQNPAIDGKRYPDANGYAMVFNVKGVAVNDFIKPKQLQIKNRPSDIFLHKITISDIKVNVKEIIGISLENGIGVQMDIAGSLFRVTELLNDDLSAKTNDLANLQIMLANLSNKYSLLGKSSINNDIIDWYKGKKNFGSIAFGGKYRFRCNSDSMYHVNKGIIAVRCDGVKNLEIDQLKIENVANYGQIGSSLFDGNYKISHEYQKIPGYHGADTTGIVCACCEQVIIDNVSIYNLLSKHGTVIGYRIINGCTNVNFYNTSAITLMAGTDGEKYIGPNDVPSAIGIKMDTSCKQVDVDKHYIENLIAPGCKVPIWTN